MMIWVAAIIGMTMVGPLTVYRVHDLDKSQYIGFSTQKECEALVTKEQSEVQDAMRMLGMSHGQAGCLEVDKDKFEKEQGAKVKMAGRAV